MQDFDTCYPQSAASALGGHLEKPVEKNIPTLAPVSLPPVGGFTTARSGAFNLEEIVSCSAAYARVSGREDPADDSISVLSTAVVEDLNILEVVRAERIVMQLSVTIAKTGKLAFSLIGSVFEGLRIAGQECRPKLNPDLLKTEQTDGMITWEDAWRVGCAQAKTLLESLNSSKDGATYQWALKQQQHMSGNPPASGAPLSVCSLVDTVETSGPSRCNAHVVEIPGFGRVTLGQLLISPHHVRLVGIRADLAGAVRGAISGPANGSGGCCVPCTNER